MHLRSFAGAGLISIIGACMGNIADAQSVRAMDLSPSAIDVTEGQSNHFAVRFDRPVDHAHSTLTIVRDGRVVEALEPRLESAPNVLFSRVPALATGEYVLHWSVRTSASDGLVQGDIPFSVNNDTFE
jgi:methionine-rich copper-binding protein CopC